MKTIACGVTLLHAMLQKVKNANIPELLAEIHTKEMKESEREESAAERLQYEEALVQSDTSVTTNLYSNFNQTPGCTIVTIILSLLDLMIQQRFISCTYKMTGSCAGVRELFKDKMPELEKTRDSYGSATTGKKRLYAAVLDEAIDTVQRQLAQMSLFSEGNDDENTIDEEKLKYAPSTNPGSESEFAKLDNRIDMSGGSTTLQTHETNTDMTNYWLTPQSRNCLKLKVKNNGSGLGVLGKLKM